MSLTREFWKATAGHSDPVVGGIWAGLGLLALPVSSLVVGATVALDVAAGVGSAMTGAAKAGGKAVSNGLAQRSVRKHELAMEAERTRRRLVEQALEDHRLAAVPDERRARIAGIYQDLEDLSIEIGKLPLSAKEQEKIGQYMKQKLFRKLREIIDER